MAVVQIGNIRIPNLQMGRMVEEDGTPTQGELVFRQGLVQSLQTYMGNEGLVAPRQPPDNVTAIQDNVNPANNNSHTCAPGTIIYLQHLTDYTQDKLLVAFRTDNTESGGPVLFKTVTVT